MDSLLKNSLIIFAIFLLSGCEKRLEGKYMGVILGTPITYEFISDKDVYVGDGKQKEKLTYKVRGNNLEVSNKEKTAVHQIVDDDEIRMEGYPLNKSMRFKIQECNSLAEAQKCNRCTQMSNLFVEYSVNKKGIVSEVEYDGNGVTTRNTYGLNASSKCSVENKSNWDCRISIESGAGELIMNDGILSIIFSDNNHNKIFSCAKPTH